MGQVPGENVVALAQVWGDLGKISDKLCFEANKISLAWVTPPQPPVSDMIAMGASLESVAVTLLAATAAFPLAAGTLVRTRLLEVVINHAFSILTDYGFDGCCSGKKYA